MVADLFTEILAVVTNLCNTLAAAISSVSDMIYVPASGDVAAHLSFLGVLLIMTVGFGIVFWVFRLIRGAAAGLAQ